MGRAVVAKASGLAVVMCMMALGAPYIARAHLVTCHKVRPVLDACGDYVKSGGDTIPVNCCNQAIILRNKIRDSMSSQRLACHCIQQVASKVPFINVTAYASIPVKCGVNLPYQFSLTMNCDRI